jgi:hypothetical protein
MFDHQWIETYAFEDIPLDRDIYLMAEKWLPEYEAAMMAFLRKETKEFNVGEVAFVAARRLEGEVMQMSWYPNVFDRFHQVRIRVPRSAFVTAVGCWQIDEKPHVFVKDGWLEDLYGRSYAVFVMIDAIGVKKAIFADQLTPARLLELQAGVDDLAGANPDMAFVSFADSLLVKANWQPLAAKGDSADYQPERLLQVLIDVQELYRRVVGLHTYAVIAQGGNEYGALMHRSESGNHLSLNSLGLPFAQIRSIDDTVRNALRSGQHAAAEVYMDSDFFHSLKLDFKFDKTSLARGTYTAPLASGPAQYVMASRDLLMAKLSTEEPAAAAGDQPQRAARPADGGAMP